MLITLANHVAHTLSVIRSEVLLDVVRVVSLGKQLPTASLRRVSRFLYGVFFFLGPNHGVRTNMRTLILRIVCHLLAHRWPLLNLRLAQLVNQVLDLWTTAANIALKVALSGCAHRVELSGISPDGGHTGSWQQLRLK